MSIKQYYVYENARGNKKCFQNIYFHITKKKQNSSPQKMWHMNWNEFDTPDLYCFACSSQRLPSTAYLSPLATWREGIPLWKHRYDGSPCTLIRHTVNETSWADNDAALCMCLSACICMQKQRYCRVSRQINAGITWFLMRGPFESKHKQGQLKTTCCERAAEDLHLKRIQSGWKKKVASEGWGNPLERNKACRYGAYMCDLFLFFPSLMVVDPSAAAKRIASKLCLKAETWLYGLTPQQHSHWFREGKTAQSYPRGVGGVFFFFLKEGAAWRDVDPGKGKCAHGRWGGGWWLAKVALVEARWERSAARTMAPDEGENVMRVTKVDVPREEKGLALNNEGLLYGCHGDEQVSQASSFLWLLPRTTR